MLEDLGRSWKNELRIDREMKVDSWKESFLRQTCVMGKKYGQTPPMVDSCIPECQMISTRIGYVHLATFSWMGWMTVGSSSVSRFAKMAKF